MASKPAASTSSLRVWYYITTMGRTRSMTTADKLKNLVDKGITDKGISTLVRLKSSDSDEWFTPRAHVALIKEVFDEIDLDVASSERANIIVGALDYFSESDGAAAYELDGHAWYGRVYCNPPYGGLAGKFAKKALYEYAAGRIDECILCLSGYAYETKWFEPILANTAIPICWVHRRVKFIRGDGTETASTVGTIYVYIGPNNDVFTAVFSSIGAIR